MRDGRRIGYVEFGAARGRPILYFWHGEQDTTVPVEMGRWLARSLPACRASFFPEDGHFSLPVNRIDEILRVLASAQ